MSQVKPWRLSPDNFTPPTRTPWGGRSIPDKYKRALNLAPDKRAFACVGESWEVSVDASFPSHIVDSNTTLRAAIEADPVAALGADIAKRYGGLPFLVKWLDAKDVLSVQVHPSNDYPKLTPKQCGKRECWFVVDAEPGAVIYLGFQQGVTRERVREAITAGESLAALMNAVPVQAGDLFDLQTGTVHALGAGVVIIEPQEVTPGKEGVTYRVWDWNRRYDATGKQDPSGQARELHIDHSLAVISFDLQGEALVAAARRTSGFVENDAFCSGVLKGTGPAQARPRGCLALTVVAGKIRAGEDTYAMGETVFFPAALTRNLTFQLEDALGVWTSA
jgi:mannose-6-phosphate isomerase